MSNDKNNTGAPLNALEAPSGPAPAPVAPPIIGDMGKGQAGQEAAHSLPAGTYPGADAPPPPPPDLPPYQPPQPQPKKRIVGLVTMALCLIVLGGILVARVFLPDLDYLFIARLTPLALVLLGIELLVAAIRHRNERVRLGVGSVLLSLLLIAGSLASAVVPDYVYMMLEHSQAERRVHQQLDNAIYELTVQAGAPAVEQVEWYVSVNTLRLTTDLDYTKLSGEDYVQARVRLTGPYRDAKAFAADCHKMLALLRQAAPQLDYASFYSFDEYRAYNQYIGDERYSLYVQGPWQLDLTAAEMEQRVETQYWLEDAQAYFYEGEYEEQRRLQEEWEREMDEADSLAYDIDRP